MTKKSSADISFLLIGGRSVLSSGLTVINESRESKLEEITALGDTDDKWGAVGQKTWEMAQEGFFDDATDKWHDALEAADPQVLMYAPEGNAIGDRAVAFSGVRTVYNVLPARGAFHKANATYKANAGPAYGQTKIAAPLATKTADGEVAAHNWGAASTDGGEVHLGVSALALGTATNIVVTVEHSIDDVAWGALATFTAVTTAPKAERKTVTGTIRQYTKVSWVFTGGVGGGTTATFCVTIERN